MMHNTYLAEIYAALSSSHALSESTTYPVVYVLDGNWRFAMLGQTNQMMRLLTQDVREAIIVGIGYPVASNEALLALRFTDLTRGKMLRSRNGSVQLLVDL